MRVRQPEYGVDVSLKRSRYLLRAVDSRKPALPQRHARVDALVGKLEALQDVGNPCVICREFGRAIPCEDCREILWQQALADEVEHAVDAAARPLQVAAAEH